MYLCIQRFQDFTTLSTGAVEHVNCSSEEEERSLINEYPRYDPNHLMLRFQFWSFREYEQPVHCYNTLVHYNSEWSYLLGSHLWIK